MINLLPDQLRTEYRFARLNRRLLRWISAFVLGIVGVGLIAGIGVFYMNQSIASYRQQIETTNRQLAAQNMAGVQKQVSDMSNNLKLALQVLSKEVLFSKLLTQLGTITPPNVILTGLSISQTEGAIDITAQTSGYNDATQLQVNLTDPNNQIFSKADIVNISCPPNPTNTKYPCTASLRALFANNNPFLFISGSPTANKVAKP